MGDSQGGIKQIDISEVVPGMFLEDLFNEKGVFLLSANSPVRSVEQIEKMKSQGIRKVHINTDKGTDVKGASPAASAPSAPPPPNKPQPKATELREVEYYQELPRAKEVRRKTHESIREILQAIRKDRNFNLEKIEEVSEEVVGSIMRNPDALVSLCQIKGYDEYTYVHSVNVGILMSSLARSMGYEGEKLRATGMGGLLHDIGKMKVPDSILNKPGKYADWEFEVMKKHPYYGLELIKNRKVPELARLVIGQHHERYNGKGYPYGLQGEQINEVGVIAAVADVYDALTSDRVYRAAWTPQKALALIFQGCDEEYSRSIAELFARHMGIYPVGSFVRLLSGEMGLVTRVESGKLLSPIVLVLFDRTGGRLKEPVEYDLSKKQKGPDGGMYKIELSLNPKAYRVDVSKFLEGKVL